MMRRHVQTLSCSAMIGAILVATVSGAGVSQVVRDSAGIVIVENGAPDRNVVAFRIGDTPLARIGRDSAVDGPSLFITEIVPLADGGYAANDVNGGRVRYHDSSGRLVRTVGGGGPEGLPAGPVRGVRPALGDSIYVLQAANRPIALLDGRGTFVRELFPGGEGMINLSNMVGAQPRPMPIGMFGDGSFVVRGQSPATVRDLTWNPAGDAAERRPLAVYLRISADGKGVLDTLGVFPGSDRAPFYTIARPGEPSVVTSLTIPGFRRSSLAVEGDRFCYGEGSTYEVRCYAPDGRLVRIIRAAVPPRAFTPVEIERAREAALKNLSGDAAIAARGAMTGVSFPPTRAVFGAMRIDDAGRVWVGSSDAQEDGAYWTVFSREGRMLGTVARPERGSIVWIGEDRIALMMTLPGQGTEIVVYELTAVAFESDR